MAQPAENTVGFAVLTRSQFWSSLPIALLKYKATIAVALPLCTEGGSVQDLVSEAMVCQSGDSRCHHGFFFAFSGQGVLAVLELAL